MRRTFVSAGVGLAFLAGIVGLFAWREWRGAVPALTPPAGDIAERLGTGSKTESPPVETALGSPLTLPQGFVISIFARDVGPARAMGADPRGTLLVSVPAEGKIKALVDEDRDGTSEKTVIVASGLNRPHGFAVYCHRLDNDLSEDKELCRLLVAEEHRISMTTIEREDFQDLVGSAGDETYIDGTAFETLIDLPAGGRHTTRTIAFRGEKLPFEEVPGTTGTLFVSVGSACDVCWEEDKRRGAILAVDLDFTRGPKEANMVVGEQRIFASGLRNAVFMAFHPRTNKLWVTEMGRDNLGDAVPPDEINIVEAGKFYGWPICYGKNVLDTDFDKNIYIRHPCQEPGDTQSHIDIPAHSAPLGLAFVPETGWPAGYAGDLLVAYHGSWNRSQPTGYKIVRYKLDPDGVYEGEEDFISGWLASDYRALGRPVDIFMGRDGVTYISDDKANVVYRVAYVGASNREQKPETPGPAAGGCVVTGCSGQVCAQQETATDCLYKEEYSCYKNAVCERQANGQCGWTSAKELQECVAGKRI